MKFMFLWCKIIIYKFFCCVVNILRFVVFLFVLYCIDVNVKSWNKNLLCFCEIIVKEVIEEKDLYLYILVNFVLF